jgi:putative DNA primase/helicase
LRSNPETAEWFSEKGDERQISRAWDKASNLPTDLPMTEDGLAMLFAAQYGDCLRYCRDTRAWFEWDGALWRHERTDLAFHWARQVCREAARAMEKPSAAIGKAATAGAVERFARADRAFAVTASQWDRDPWLLGTPAGTVDLRTGRLREAMPTDYITKATSVPPAPTADCPLWLKFIDEVTQGDARLGRFLQQFFGYGLTGIINEHALIFVYGTGNNGKSVLQETIVSILGDYAVTAAMETFLSSRNDRHTTELAMLRGARLVAAAETEQGRNWNETKIKLMTGGDMITARRLYQDFSTFKPQFKISCIGNHKPKLRDVGPAMRRRFNIVPFAFKPANADRRLLDKLRGEHPGILRWLIDGCLDWQRNGLIRPRVVVKATDDSFAEQDIVSRWLEEHCDTSKRFASETVDNLFADFCRYVELANERRHTRSEFTEQLERLGYQRRKSPPGYRDKWCWEGLMLKPDYCIPGMDYD